MSKGKNEGLSMEATDVLSQRQRQKQRRFQRWEEEQGKKEAEGRGPCKHRQDSLQTATPVDTSCTNLLWNRRNTPLRVLLEPALDVLPAGQRCPLRTGLSCPHTHQHTSPLETASRRRVGNGEEKQRLTTNVFYRPVSRCITVTRSSRFLISDCNNS